MREMRIAGTYAQCGNVYINSGGGENRAIKALFEGRYLATPKIPSLLFGAALKQMKVRKLVIDHYVW